MRSQPQVHPVKELKEQELQKLVELPSFGSMEEPEDLQENPDPGAADPPEVQQEDLVECAGVVALPGAEHPRREFNVFKINENKNSI